MLGSDFFVYKIKEKSEDSCIVEVNLNKDSTIYNGHFPDMPVTPGVCQVQIVSEILNSCLGTNYRLISAKDIKFMNLINPNEVSSFILTIKIKQFDDNTIGINAIMGNNDKTYLKIRSSYKLA